MLDRSTRESEQTPSEPTVTVHPAAGSARRPIRSEFARLGPTFAARRVVTAVIALAVLGGALYVTLGLGGHGTSQEVPVIKAEGDYKEKPEDPGGIDIPHQDVQVYQKLDQQGGDAPLAEHLLPQAETPQAQLMPSGTTTFSDNATIEAAHLPSASDNNVQQPVQGQGGSEISAPDASVASAASNVATNVESAAAAVSGAVAASGGTSVVAEPAAAPSVPVATTSSPVASSGAPALSVPASTHDANAAASVSSSVGAKPVSVAPAPAPAPIPSVPVASTSPHVPETVSTASKKTEATVAAISQSLASAPAPKIKPQAPAATASSSGGRGGAVQLASFPDRAVAEQSIDKMQAKYGAHLGGAKLRVVQADLGAKGIYYRIQSQQLPESKAKEICAALKSMKAGCLVVHP